MEFQDIYKDLNIQQLEQKLQRLSLPIEISFADMIKELYQGNGEGLLQLIWQEVVEEVRIQLQDWKSIFITVVIIILISAFFSRFKDIFQNSQISDISFYINYLLLVLLFIHLFGSMLEIGENTLRQMEEFMRIFFPTYFLIVGSTAGTATGLAYYQLSGGIIYLVEYCLISVVLPALSTYMFFVLMNGIWEEEKLTFSLEIFQKGLKLLLKLLLGILTGTGMLHSMIVPIVDQVKGQTVFQAVEAIPGIGDVAEGAFRIWMGSAVLIKNSVGAAGCIFLIVLCLIPIFRIGAVGCVIKITTAILSFAGDKRMIACMYHVGDGILMILQTVFYGVLFFLVLIAITIYTTNGGI